MTTDVLIIGSGPAGITAAIYAARAGLKVTVCEKNMYGGQVSIIDEIENYPGFNKINGLELSNLMQAQAEKLGVDFIYNEVIKADFKNKVITLSNNTNIETKTIIIANGLKRKTLNIPGEKEFAGKGVSYCATCDGSFFKAKDIVIVGGGNTALKDALYLSNICKSVTIIVRKDHTRGEKMILETVKNKKNIEIKYNSELTQINGDKLVNSVFLKNNISGEISKLDIQGVFVAVGYSPDCEIYKNQIDLDENGYFKSDESCETNIKGVFVAGDCRKKPLRQIVTATCDGAVAGNKAAEYISEYLNL